MAGVTGYSDTFNRTVAAGSLGTATSGQSYTLSGTAADFSVNGTQGVITPSALNSERLGTVNLLTSDVNIAGQVAVSALPASGQVISGFTVKEIDSSNYYYGALIITSAGAVTLRILKRVAGVGTIVATSATIAGLTIVANTFVGIRVYAAYDTVAATNRFFVKVWSLSAAEPYGWQLVTADASLVGGTNQGLLARNEGPATTISFLFENVATATESLPFPAGTDPMCYDPTYPYPKQTVLQSLATAIDTYMGNTIEPDAARALASPRVRISKSNYSQAGTIINGVAFDTVEYNIGTPTDLSVDPLHLVLGVGIWILRAEIIIPGSTTMTDGTLTLANANADVGFRIDAGTGGGNNFTPVGASSQVAALVDNSSGTLTEAVNLSVDVTSGGLSFTYLALSAMKISDYFV